MAHLDSDGQPIEPHEEKCSETELGALQRRAGDGQSRRAQPHMSQRHSMDSLADL